MKELVRIERRQADPTERDFEGIQGIQLVARLPDVTIAWVTHDTQQALERRGYTVHAYDREDGSNHESHPVALKRVKRNIRRPYRPVPINRTAPPMRRHNSPKQDWTARRISKNFVLGEFVRWGTARGPHREPPPEVLEQITRLVSTILQPLRTDLGQAVHVLSGWRPADLYTLPQGQTSAHTLGAAADVLVNGLTPGELAQHADALADDGLIAEGGVGVYPAGYPSGDGGTREVEDPTVHLDTGAHTQPGPRRWPLAWWHTVS